MFLPLGDNVDRKIFPMISLLLIWGNVMVFGYQLNVSISSQKDLSGQEVVWTVAEGGLTTEAGHNFIKTWGLVPEKLNKLDIVGVLSHMFVHGGLMHLLGNMIVLWAFACSLEESWGKSTLLGFYILFGLVGGIAHAVSDWGSSVPLVGASGAIAGLIGAYTVLFGATSRIRTLIFLGLRPFVVHIPASIFGGGWIILQLLEASSESAQQGGVAWWAHIGGFFAGAGVAYAFRNDCEAKLVVDSSGKILFESSATQECPDVDAASESLATCLYCSTEVGDEHIFSSGLARCPKCNNLVCINLNSPQFAGAAR